MFFSFILLYIFIKCTIYRHTFGIGISELRHCSTFAFSFLFKYTSNTYNLLPSVQHCVKSWERAQEAPITFSFRYKLDYIEII